MKVATFEDHKGNMSYHDAIDVIAVRKRIDLVMILAYLIIEVMCGLIWYCAFVHRPNTWLIFGTFINVNYFTSA